MDKPIWEPGKERTERANLSRFIRFVREQHPHTELQDYRALYDYSIRNPEKFWTLIWDFCGIKAHGEREPVLVDAHRMPGARWFPGVRLNFAQNLLRYRDDRTALWFRGESGIASAISYAELHEQVGALTAAMKARGVAMGDRV